MTATTATIVFDMDDTLYLERDFVRSGYRAVCESLMAEGKLSSAEAGRDWLWNRFLAGNAAGAFDALNTQFALNLTEEEIAGLVELYRTHSPDISLNDETRALLEELAERDDVRLALITDGPAVMQESKFYALGLDDPKYDIAPVIFTARLGADAGKPSKIAYELIQQSQPALTADRFVYIADNLKKDFLAPNALGWHSICFRQPGQIHAHYHAPEGGAPEHVCDPLEEVRYWLRTWIDGQ